MGIEDDGDGLVNIGPGKSAHDAHIKYDRDQAKRKDELSDSSDLTLVQRKERLDKKVKELESYMEKNKDRLGPAYVHFLTVENENVGELQIPVHTDIVYFGRATREKGSKAIDFKGYRLKLSRFREMMEEELESATALKQKEFSKSAKKFMTAAAENGDVAVPVLEYSKKIDAALRSAEHHAFLDALEKLKDEPVIRKSVSLYSISRYSEWTKEDLDIVGLMKKIEGK